MYSSRPTTPSFQYRASRASHQSWKAVPTHLLHPSGSSYSSARFYSTPEANLKKEEREEDLQEKPGPADINGFVDGGIPLGGQYRPTLSANDKLEKAENPDHEADPFSDMFPASDEQGEGELGGSEGEMMLRRLSSSKKLPKTTKSELFEPATSAQPGSSAETKVFKSGESPLPHEWGPEDEDVQPRKKAETTAFEHTSYVEPHLTHVNSKGEAHMVPVAQKNPTHRIAIAVSSIFFSNPDVYDLIAQNGLKKGDALSTARLAGIMASKNTSTLIPLCHTLPLANTEVNLELTRGIRKKGSLVLEGPFGTYGYGTNGGVAIEAVIQCHGPTGVEMEALTAAQVAAMTVYDMCKAVDKGMQLGPGRVVMKTGGKSGSWVEKEYKDGNPITVQRFLDFGPASGETEVVSRSMGEFFGAELRGNGEAETHGSAEEGARLLEMARADLRSRPYYQLTLNNWAKYFRQTWTKNLMSAPDFIAKMQMRLESDIESFLKLLEEKQAEGGYKGSERRQMPDDDGFQDRSGDARLLAESARVRRNHSWNGVKEAMDGSEDSERGQCQDLVTLPNYERRLQRLSRRVLERHFKSEGIREVAIRKYMGFLLGQWTWGEDEIPMYRRRQFLDVAEQWARALAERRKSIEENGEAINKYDWDEDLVSLKPPTRISHAQWMISRLQKKGFDVKALEDWQALLEKITTKRETDIRKEVDFVLDKWSWGEDLPVDSREDYVALAAQWALEVVERTRSKAERGEVMQEGRWGDNPVVLQPPLDVRHVKSMINRLSEMGFDVEALEKWCKLLNKDFPAQFPSFTQYVPSRPKKFGGWPKWH